MWQLPDKAELATGPQKGSQAANARASAVKPVSFWVRVHNRIAEMRERRKRLVRMQLKDQQAKGAKKNFAQEFAEIVERKEKILR